ncbi:unnamed protein product [Vitrella brassicaformis CCMP3155]|uniref:Protein kinase domain-containing protein n=2 Tax=Vitrella brassicaformis TaxID=1169539 RepID=A0A0G4GG85_VITBC|nr:unnamed protein product [Vitrella brassicaformis CCMP3155]|eukprot:CEM28375.1 unnamed protein product [Vitrella brassicaformis CCMP3155]
MHFMLLDEVFAPPPYRVAYDQRMGDLPWFLGHPWEPTDYAIVRVWQEYDKRTGEGRYEAIRVLQAAQRNKGHVYLHYDHKEKKHVAVKMVPKSFVQQAQAKRDTEQPLGDTGCLRYLTILNGPATNIATWIDCGQDAHNMYFVSEFAAGGDMFEFLTAKPMVPEESLKRLIYQILDGVRFMHAHRIVHLDLSVENVLMRYDCPANQNCAILIDFGMAQRLRPNPSARPGESPYLPIPDKRGKNKYQDPVMWTKKPYDGPKADIFSVGMIFFHLLTVPLRGQYMIEHTNMYDKINVAIKFTYLMTYGIEKFFRQVGSEFATAVKERMSPAGIDLLKHLIKLNPQDRPTAEQALTHSWFNSVRAALAPPRPPPSLVLSPAASAAATASTEAQAHPHKEQQSLPSSRRDSIEQERQGSEAMRRAHTHKNIQLPKHQAPHHHPQQAGEGEKSPRDVPSTIWPPLSPRERDLSPRSPPSTIWPPLSPRTMEAQKMAAAAHHSHAPAHHPQPPSFHMSPAPPAAAASTTQAPSSSSHRSSGGGGAVPMQVSPQQVPTSTMGPCVSPEDVRMVCSEDSSSPGVSGESAGAPMDGPHPSSHGPMNGMPSSGGSKGTGGSGSGSSACSMAATLPPQVKKRSRVGTGTPRTGGSAGG